MAYNYTKQTLKEIYDTIISDYEARTENITPLLEIAVVKSLAWAYAGILSLIWSLSLWQYLQVFVQTADLPALKWWGELVNLPYKEGTTTTIQVSITGVTASSVSAGTVWKNLSSGVVYTAISSTDTVDGNIIINASASIPGAAGNVADNTVLTIANPLVGVPDTATVFSTLLTGSEPEEIEVYRQRVLTRYQKKPQGGAAIDYYLWATEVGGIVDAFPYVLNEGEVTLYIVATGSGQNRTPTGNVAPNPFPNWVNGQPVDMTGSGEFLQVANAINSSDGVVNDRRPMQVPVNLLPPIYTGYNIEILGLTPVTDEIKTNIRNALISYLDIKRPHIAAIGYPAQDALINAIQLTSIVQNTIDSGTFTSFTLKNISNNAITSDTLGIGALAYLNSLTINGSVVNL